MEAEPTKLAPKPKTKHDRYREFDVVAQRVKRDPGVRLLTLDGEQALDSIIGVDRYCFFLKNKTGLHKTSCVGAFPEGYESLVASKEHPVREVSHVRNQRYNDAKMQVLYPEYRKGLRLKVILMNGWELVGDIEDAGQFYVGLRLSETKTVHLYRHAIADYEWVGGEPAAVSPEEAQKTEQQRRDLSHRPKKSPKKAPKKPTPQTAPQVVSAPTKPLAEIWKEEVARTMVNAKLKIVLKEVPTTIREADDVFWIPLQNQPNGAPKGFDLSPMTVDLVVSKKIWKGALKKAQEQKEQTGNDALYVVEALIGTYQNRFCALASGIQVAEAKPRMAEPKQAEAKPVEVAPEAKPIMAEVVPTAKSLKAKDSEASKPTESKSTPKGEMKESGVVPKVSGEIVPESKKRIFTATVDGIEARPVVAEAKPKANEPKVTPSKAKPKPVEVTYVPSSKSKK